MSESARLLEVLGDGRPTVCTRSPGIVTLTVGVVIDDQVVLLEQFLRPLIGQYCCEIDNWCEKFSVGSVKSLRSSRSRVSVYVDDNSAARASRYWTACGDRNPLETREA